MANLYRFLAVLAALLPFALSFSHRLDGSIKIAHGPSRLASSLTTEPLAAVATPADAYDKEPRGKAYPLQTPHSGRHFDPSHPAYRKRSLWKRRRRRRRFMEGWYYRLTLPERGASFAFIVSIEDPGVKPPSDLRLSCIQVIGPDDGYCVQADRDDTKFWAWKHQQGLGCTFEWKHDDEDNRMKTYLSENEWNRTVRSGFQITPNHMMGRVHGHDGSLGGVLPGQGIPNDCSFDFSFDPLCGFGDQKSTAGWLSYMNIFEPHWQVTLADARATGWVTWKNETFYFENAPFYAEKNWGASLPSKWYWTQCNSFPGYDQLSVTAGGGIRRLPFGQTESLGMVCVHYNNQLFEAVPWTGSMEWNVAKWGSWELRGTCLSGDAPFEVEITYECDPETMPGLIFRAPTPDEGMVLFCKDTFEATTKMSLWLLEWDDTAKQFCRKPGRPLIDGATSLQGGAEIGGGPWWDTWKGKSKLKKVISVLLNPRSFRRRI